jgi:hypothetical protein
VHQHHDLIAAIGELFGLKRDFLECRRHIHEEPPYLLAAVMRPGPNRLPFDVPVHRADDGIPVSAAGCLVPTTKRFDICLRHRLRSISALTRT